MSKTLNYVGASGMYMRGLPPIILAPSQIINIPAGVCFLCITSAIVLIVNPSAILYGYRFDVIVLLAGLIVLPLPACICIRTALTEFVIDAESITQRRGVINQKTAVLDLCKIKTITVHRPFWQGLFGVSTIIIVTSDHHVWHLPGMRNSVWLCEQLIRAAAAAREVRGAA